MLKATVFNSIFLCLLLSVLISCDKDDDEVYEEIVVTANRASGSVSFINAENNEVLNTLNIPASEPMYVNYVSQTDMIYVGDRAQNIVHVIDPQNQSLSASIPVGNGVFHMWPKNDGTQLWVNNDVDNTVSVIDLFNNRVARTIDLAGKPHDVMFSGDDSRAYVSIIAGDMTIADSLYAYNTTSYEKLVSVPVGDDPHVFYLNGQDKLYSPNQSGQVLIFDKELNQQDVVDVPGAHGIFSRNDIDVFVSNLPGAELYKLNGITNDISGNAVATTQSVPHNLVVNADNNRLYVTHSGMNNTLTVYDITDNMLDLVETITVGDNPFGIGYYKRKQ